MAPPDDASASEPADTAPTEPVPQDDYSHPEIRKELISQWGATYRWVLAALLTLNGGGLYVQWHDGEVPIDEMFASLIFVTGLLVALSSAWMCLQRYEEAFRGIAHTVAPYTAVLSTSVKTWKGLAKGIVHALFLPEGFLFISAILFLAGTGALGIAKSEAELAAGRAELEALQRENNYIEERTRELEERVSAASNITDLNEAAQEWNAIVNDADALSDRLESWPERTKPDRR